MRKTIQASLALLFALAFGCAKPEPSYVTTTEPPNVAGNERAFVGYSLQHLSPTLEQVTCHCCNKSLKQCLGEMGQGGACPFH